ncbi:protein translocase subunit SecD [Tabrizicola sp. J26]|uniref:protein translocase subunit SecD n=1 Tax=Alitabrizicola rongguiensis TaxID=2909234 RepID=UPI001F2C168C|nr:protein translocase subunit SecD [Tabrizicola rongguiensis]MCF1709642.1 protein translocase subunit SecD [Tabrizicola rongguiensis]
MQTPLWKRLLIWAVVAAGLLYAMPNAFYSRVEKHNDATAAIEKAAGAATPAQEADVALWPNWLPSGLVNLGLDLRGGAHLLAEVQVADVYADRIDILWPEARDSLRQARDAVGNVRRLDAPPGELKIKISNPDGMAKAVEIVRGLAQPVTTLTGVGQSSLEVSAEGDTITIQLSAAEKAATDERTMAQSLEIVRRRIDEAGTREPTIQRQGADRILIQVPGIGTAAELKSLIGTTARLTFNPVVGRASNANADPGSPRNVVLPERGRPGSFLIIERTPVVGGEDLVDAQPAFDQNGGPAVNFRFNPAGARAFGDYTANNIGSPFAIVLDNEVVSAPTIQSHIAGGSGIITGNFTVEESTELAVLLRSGALPAKLNFLEERTIGPELGQDSIDAGRVAAIIGMVAVSALMIACYGLFGVFATVALAINMALIFAVLSIIGGTLTLPGIAGIVLTIGMAVDANVLVYERIREELRVQKGPARAIEIGYERAMSAIIDANLTTMITALVLFFMGAGPVRGFAITLAIGIVTSVFTALLVTRQLIEIWYGWRRPKTIVV